jgi:hypothetical protein
MAASLFYIGGIHQLVEFILLRMKNDLRGSGEIFPELIRVFVE